jgi:hypothetical protein
MGEQHLDLLPFTSRRHIGIRLGDIARDFSDSLVDRTRDSACGHLQVHLFAQPPFGMDAVPVANHEQFGTNRRLASSANGAKQQEHVAQVRTHRTAPPNRPAADPSSIQVSTHRRNQRSRSASTGELLNTIGAIGKALVLAADVSALAAAHERSRSHSFRSDCGCSLARRSRCGLTRRY